MPLLKQKINDRKEKKSFFFRPKNVLFLIVSIIIVVNCAVSFFDILDLYSKRKKSPLFFMGAIFTSLDKILKDTKYVGYITDKSMDVNNYAAQFAQAQYILAPTILELNNPNHEFLILDCTNESITKEKLIENKAIPIKKNKFGIILAKRLSAAPASLQQFNASLNLMYSEKMSDLKNRIPTKDHSP